MGLQGNVLLIANPVAQNGNGAASALRAIERLRALCPDADISLVMTEAPHHGQELAARSFGRDAVVALGGDGLIHEVANGLMAVPEDVRPALGVIPVGSGNDYARTLGMSPDLDRALDQLARTVSPTAFDLGVCNGEYFVETLSFGLDAAIAIDTVSRRKRTGRTGTLLYLESGIDMLLHHITEHRYTMSCDGEDAVRGSTLLFAVQIGPTYGGGFKICPDALYDDGLLDLCIAHPPLGIPKAIGVFLLAKGGHHTGFKMLEFLKTSRLVVEFEEEVPVQIDGEPFPGLRFDVSVANGALRVLKP